MAYNNTQTDLQAEFQRVTIPHFIRVVEKLLMRNTFLFRRLSGKGKIKTGIGGAEMVWLLKMRRGEVETWTNNTPMDFTPTSRHIQMRIGPKGYRAKTSFTKMDKEINKGPEAIINLYQEKANDLREDILATFQGEIYKSGTSSGRTDRLDGLETGLAAGTVVAADKVAAPAGSYAGQSTVLKANGGFWTNTYSTPANASLGYDWPYGNGDVEVDCNSPKLINTSSTSWGTGSTDPRDNIYRAILQGQTWLTTLGGQDGKPDVCVLDSYLFQGLRENQEAKLRIMVPVRSGVDLGLPGSDGEIYLDGLGIEADFWCPPLTGYMFNTSQMDLFSYFGQLFDSEGPDVVPQLSYSTVWAIFSLGNVRYKAMKHFAKLYPYA